MRSDTFRIVMQASEGGSAVRLRLSDDLGWLAGSSAAPLNIGDVTVAPAVNGAAIGTPQQVTFGGSIPVVIPEGGDVYSDPVGMTVTPGEYLSVSIFLSDSEQYLVQHSMCSSCTEYVSALGSDDQAWNTDGSAFTGSGTLQGQFTDILTGVDVETGGTPTAAVLGDGLVDATSPSSKAPVQGVRLAADLASAVQSNAAAGTPPAFGVADDSIESNQLLTDGDDTSPGTGGAVGDVPAGPGRPHRAWCRHCGGG
jgi:hypothetical protein